MGQENEAVLSCLLIEDDDEAFSCLKVLIKNWPEQNACKPSIVLLTQEDCDPCDEEHARLAEDIEAGIIEVVDFTSERGQDIAKRNNIEAVPAVLILDCQDMLIQDNLDAQDSPSAHL